MKRRITIAIVLTFVAMACFRVVINVYFPESEAKGALATLEDELLKESPGESAPAQPEKPAGDNGRKVKPEKTGRPDSKPSLQQSRVVGLFESQSPRAAVRVTEQQLYERIKAMPHVIEAYQRMAARLPRVNALRDSGAVGEGNDGMLHERRPITSRRDRRTISDENADRRKVIHGLAKADLLAQGLPVDREHINSVTPQAAATFASLRRSKAKPGWWVQKTDGSWKRKGR